MRPSATSRSTTSISAASRPMRMTGGLSRVRSRGMRLIMPVNYILAAIATGIRLLPDTPCLEPAVGAADSWLGGWLPGAPLVLTIRDIEQCIFDCGDHGIGRTGLWQRARSEQRAGLG